ncbi:hypothetical protein [Pontibacter russatus]|uniref:hypothetical protein n=1 Tax=Pontibacter russatus TaxID=2694929 RepID=UPI00137A28F4|nr:hypothetical protein [Pontibacter russatus]
MKKASILAALIMAVFGCETKNPESITNKPSKADYQKNKNSRFTVISDTSETIAVTHGSKKLWEPTEEQIFDIEAIIKTTIANDPGVGNRHLKPDSIESIYKQYVCFVDSNGDSLVYINASCRVREILVTDSVTNELKFKKFDWRNSLFGTVLDGGDCFWNMLINFSEKKTLELNVNGEA